MKIQRLSLLFDGIIIYDHLKKDPVILSLRELLNGCVAKEFNLTEVYRHYHNFCSLATEIKWPEYLWDLILQDENEFTRQVADTRRGITQNLRNLALRDLLIWREIGNLTPKEIKETIQNRVSREGNENQGLWSVPPFSPESWPDWISEGESSPTNMSFAERFLHDAQDRIKSVLAKGESEEIVEEIISFYENIGSGRFSQALAFKWQGSLEILKGVKPDPLRKEQLIGQDREQGIILQNTEFFLAGYPANNVILYGNRGTGKSSLVKALLQQFCDRGLRLIELAKTDLNDFPKVIRQLAEHPQKFIIFIDDLSFEESESEYKNLKTLLEGGLEGRPKNVLIYATSNRRHLVRESFSERQGDEVHRRDNMEEKLSLADRFGITVTFPSPDQEGYLKIVQELAAQEGIQMDSDLLRQQALSWVMRHNARSGRTARQFIDYLAASQGVAAK